MLRAIEKSLNKITTPVSKILRHLGGILLLVMTIIVVIQVLFRYLFNIPLGWTDESSRFLMIYMTYICLPFVYLTDKNIAMTYVTDILQKKAPRFFAFLTLIGHLCAILVFSVWITFGWNFFLTGSVSADSLPIPMFYIYIMPPLMMAITLVYALQKAVASLRGILGDFEDISQTAMTADLYEGTSGDSTSQEKTVQLEPKTAA